MRAHDKTGTARRWSARMRQFWTHSGGTVTIEFVIWLPVFLVLLAITADACKLYVTQSNMLNVARDTARRMAVGKLCTVAAATTYAQQQMLYSSLTYTYTITVTTDSNTVTIATPIAGAGVFNLLRLWGSFDANGVTSLTASATMPAEPGICT
jgi:Flp pilus assembly protein TadG